jgi:hypothetical protein
LWKNGGLIEKVVGVLGREGPADVGAYFKAFSATCLTGLKREPASVEVWVLGFKIALPEGPLGLRREAEEAQEGLPSFAAEFCLKGRTPDRHETDFDGGFVDRFVSLVALRPGRAKEGANVYMRNQRCFSLMLLSPSPG